jgi:hypothetical protein
MGQPLDVIFKVGLRAVQAELDDRCQGEVVVVDRACGRLG